MTNTLYAEMSNMLRNITSGQRRVLFLHFSFLWHVGHLGRVGLEHKLKGLFLVFSSWGRSSGLFSRTVPTIVSLLLEELLSQLALTKMFHCMCCGNGVPVSRPGQHASLGSSQGLLHLASAYIFASSTQMMKQHHRQPRSWFHILRVYTICTAWRAAAPKWHKLLINSNVGPRVVKQGKASTHLSHTDLIAASLSLCRWAGLVSRLEKQIILEIMWKFSRDVAQMLPVSASHRDSVDSPLDLKTPARIRTPKYACK